MKLLDRQEVIEDLVNDEVNNIKDMLLQDDYTYLDSMIRYGGILGVTNMTDKDLVVMYEERFADTIKIGVFENWSNLEMCELLVYNGSYESVNECLNMDRIDLVDECYQAFS